MTTEGPQTYISIKGDLAKPLTRTRGEEDLYDLEADPYELRDLASDPQHRQRLLSFKQQVLDWWRRTGGKPLQVQ